MRNNGRNFVEICHGCGREVYTYEHHWKAKLGGREKYTYFHNGCYKHYKEVYPTKVRVAEEKYRV